MDTRQLHEYRLAAIAVVAAGFFSSLYLPGWRAWAAIAGMVVAFAAACWYSQLVHKRTMQSNDARRFAGAYLDEAVNFKNRFTLGNGRDEKDLWCEAVKGFVCAAWGTHWFLTFDVDHRENADDQVRKIAAGLNDSLRIWHELPVEPSFEWESRPEWWGYFPAHSHLMRMWTARQKLESSQ